jgi:hypothetical protein
MILQKTAKFIKLTDMETLILWLFIALAFIFALLLCLFLFLALLVIRQAIKNYFDDLEKY